ncbi:MAG: SIMPL domain-containing protein [Bacteroidales bacterium]|jgi:hypothetical protein
MKQHFNTILIFAGIIIAAMILGNSWKKAHSDNRTIEVNGIAKQDIVSDQIVWTGYLSADAKDTKTAYAELKKDTGIFKKYLLSKGLHEKEITFSPVAVQSDNNWVYNSKGIRVQKIKGYTLTQNVRIESKEVEKVENTSLEVSELIDQGINFVEQSTEYYYTKLDELKLKMISAAVEEAHKRALLIATNSNCVLGDLKHSELNTFDVTAKNSSEEFTEGSRNDYYGDESFNTTSKNKIAMVTVKLEFGIN